MTNLQDYSLTSDRESEAAFADFSKAYYDFGFPAVSMRYTPSRDGEPELSVNYKVSAEFLEFILYNVKGSTLTFAHSIRKNDIYSILDGETLLAEIRDGRLVKLCMPGLEKRNAHTHFLATRGVEYVEEANFPDLINSGAGFMREAYELKHISVPKMQDAGNDWLRNARRIQVVETPSAVRFGNNVLYSAEELVVFKADNARKFGKDCFHDGNMMKKMSLPSVESLGDGFMYGSTGLYEVDAKKLTKVGKDCEELFYIVCSSNLARLKKSK